MNFYPINITDTVSEEKLLKGTFIFIYRATRIPPHIGIIANGFLYDITSVGPNIDIAVKDFYRTSVNRKMEVLFVELNISGDKTNDLIKEKVRKYWKVDDQTSCLAPVKEFLKELAHINTQNITFLFDLLPVLENENKIVSIYELNLQPKIKDGVFKLVTYTKQDIVDCITALTRKEKATC